MSGKIGPKGVKGDVGQRGEKGERGYPGPQGPKGNKGDKGESGYLYTRGKASTTRLVYPSVLFYPLPEDLLVPNFQVYDIYPLSGWYFTQGTLSFPLKNCCFDDIESIDIAFYAFNDSTFSIDVNTETNPVKYSGSLTPGSYQASTRWNRFVYDEKFVFLKTNDCSSSKVTNITIPNSGNTFIISSIRITYNDYEMIFQLLNY